MHTKASSPPPADPTPTTHAPHPAGEDPLPNSDIATVALHSNSEIEADALRPSYDIAAANPLLRSENCIAKNAQNRSKKKKSTPKPLLASKTSITNSLLTFYKSIQFEFRKHEKRPIFDRSNSLISIDPLFIKFYQNSYQSLTKDNISKRVENFDHNLDIF